MQELAKHIDHTLLRPDTVLADVRRVCEEAIQHQFAAVCVPPLFMRDARRMLGERNRVQLSTVVGFPMGYSAIAAKSEEIKRALDEGADEIDAVVNLAAIKSGNWNLVGHDVAGLALATHMRGKALKLTIECGFLTPDELRQLCNLAGEHRIDWLTTGTGLHGFPATPAMVRQLIALAAPNTKIKAVGGIRTVSNAQALIEAGCSRLGTSTAVALLG